MLSSLNVKKDNDKDVFDVINERANRSSKEMLFALPKLVSLVFRANKLKSEGKDIDSIEHDLMIVIKKIVPVAIETSHYAYEVYKEIDYNYGNDRLLEYVKDSGKDPLEFAYTYNNNKNTMIKLLAMLAILHDEGIKLEDFNDSDIALRVINGEVELDVIASKFENISDAASDKIEFLLDKQTTYKDLTEEEMNILEKYHFEYMTNNVYPYTTENNDVSKGEDRVLKLASKLGGKARK